MDVIQFLNKEQSYMFYRNKGSSLVQINKTLNYEAEPSMTYIFVQFVIWIFIWWNFYNVLLNQKIGP